MSEDGNEERNGYRALYDHTMRAIKRGEEFKSQLEEVLAKKGSHEPIESLLDSTRRGIEVLRQEAEQLEKLGWPDKDDGEKD